MRGIWWVDLNEEDLKAAQDILTDDNPDTIDDLGFGSIRDLISDMLFPATSTIMTEIKYFIFVPAIFRYLEKYAIKGEVARTTLEDMENQLRIALREGKEVHGVFGSRSERPQRLPSDVYWAALRTIGIHQFSGSRNRYLASMNADFYRRIKEWQSRSKQGRVYDDLEPQHFLSSSFPTEWEQINTSTNFTLSPEETKWLIDRFELTNQVNRSLFVRLLRRDAYVPDKQKSLPPFWEIYNMHNMPEHGELIHHARCYSYLQLGSQHMYNYLIKSSDEHRAAFEEWRHGEEFDFLQAWNFPSFEKLLVSNPRKLAFHSGWLREVLSPATTGELSTRILPVFRERERNKKGEERSRLYNPERAATYHFPTDPYRFRWNIAHKFLVRLREGM